jgi:hypothetical protein
MHRLETGGISNVPFLVDLEIESKFTHNKYPMSSIQGLLQAAYFLVLQFGQLVG